ncbi:MAG: hypothetical protein QM784_25920 [Polyangiaceae bacterium]
MLLPVPVVVPIPVPVLVPVLVPVFTPPFEPIVLVVRAGGPEGNGEAEEKKISARLHRELLGG